jgi:uncharacterized membrane protein
MKLYNEIIVVCLIVGIILLEAGSLIVGINAGAILLSIGTMLLGTIIGMSIEHILESREHVKVK